MHLIWLAGVPAVIVGIVAAVDYDLFRGPED